MKILILFLAMLLARPVHSEPVPPVGMPTVPPPTKGNVAWHLYVAPLSLVNQERVADYLAGIRHDLVPIGVQLLALVAAEVTPAQDTQISAQATVLRIPDDLDQTLSAGAVTIVQNFLEARNLPAQWVNTSQTYRFVVRTVWGYTIFATQFVRETGITNPIIGGAVTLATQYQSLPVNVRNGLTATATALKLDTSAITATSTVRQIITSAASQLNNRPYVLGGITI